MMQQRWGGVWDVRIENDATEVRWGLGCPDGNVIA